VDVEVRREGVADVETGGQQIGGHMRARVCQER
jgi:hypothetical protein